MVWPRQPTSPLPGWRHKGMADPQAGDVMLIEAYDGYVGNAAWSQSFSLVRRIPESSPPRYLRPYDRLRAALVCCGMLLLITLVSANMLDICAGACILVLVFL